MSKSSSDGITELRRPSPHAEQRDPRGSTMLRRVGAFVRGYRAWLVLILLGIVATIASGGIFARGSNLVNILFLAAPVGVAALGQTMVIITAGIDLSTSAIWALAAIVCGTLAGNGVNIGIAVAAAVGVGLVGGLINGGLISYLNIPPLIATLGMLGVAEGIARLYTNNQAILELPDQLRKLGTATLGPVPLTALIWVVLTLACAFRMHRTVAGKGAYALGGNPTAARYSGLRVDGILVSTYSIAGVLSALAGVLNSAYFNIAVPNASSTTLFVIIAAAVVGGANLFGGEGNVANSFAGVLVIVVIENLLNILGVNPLVEQGVPGVVIFLAVLINVLSAGTRGQILICQKGI